MTSRWRWLLLQLTRRMWVRATLFALLGVATALAAIVLGRYVPEGLPARIGADAVDGILGILASSMLAVTTFSLSVVVAAYGSATSHVTPRATRLLVEDTSTQNMLATFIGSFLFSLVGLVTLSAGAYGDRGRLVLFAVTLVVIALIVVTLLRWIEHITKLGRVGETTERVEHATRDAVRARMDEPHLGGRPVASGAEAPAGARPLFGERIGYVQHIDLEAITACAEEHGLQCHVAALPGSFVHPAQPLVHVSGPGAGDDRALAAVRDAFTIGDERSFQQDPRFGLSVLAEIASRALSPAVNDPGTAIDVIGRTVRILDEWREPDMPGRGEGPRHPRISVPAIDVDDLFDDAYGPIARDGAGVVEVQLRLHKALLALAMIDPVRFATSSLRHSRMALARAEKANMLDFELKSIRSVAARIETACRAQADSR